MKYLFTTLTNSNTRAYTYDSAYIGIMNTLVLLLDNLQYIPNKNEALHDDISKVTKVIKLLDKEGVRAFEQFKTGLHTNNSDLVFKSSTCNQNTYFFSFRFRSDNNFFVIMNFHSNTATKSMKLKPMSNIVNNPSYVDLIKHDTNIFI